MSRYSDQVRDEYGRTVPGVSIYVYKWDADADAAGDLETLTDDLSAPLGNPLTSDADGLFYFNSVDGQKLIEYHFGGKVEFRDLILVGPVPVPQAVFGGLFVNASALSIPVGMDMIGTTGYAALGVGGANYIYDATVDAAYVTAHPLSSFISANSRGFRLDDEQDLALEMFGAIRNSSTSGAKTANNAALTAALAYGPIVVDTYYGPSRTIKLLEGYYHFSQSYFNVKHSVALLGAGGWAGVGGYCATRFIGPLNWKGLIFQDYNTINETTEGTPTTSSSGSLVVGIEFIGNDNIFSNWNNITSGQGIWARTMISVVGCKFTGLYDGWVIQATAGSGGATEGQASGCFGMMNSFMQCRHDGLHIEGADANVGRFIHHNYIAIGRFGVYDWAFLGNDHDGGHFRECGGRTDYFNVASQCYFSGYLYYVNETARPNPEAAFASDPATTDAALRVGNPSTNSLWTRLSAGVAGLDYPDFTTFAGTFQKGGPIIIRRGGVAGKVYGESGQPPFHGSSEADLDGGTVACGFLGFGTIRAAGQLTTNTYTILGQTRVADNIANRTFEVHNNHVLASGLHVTSVLSQGYEADGTTPLILAGTYAWSSSADPATAYTTWTFFTRTFAGAGAQTDWLTLNGHPSTPDYSPVTDNFLSLGLTAQRFKSVFGYVGDFKTSVLCSGSGGVGYSTGAGGAVTQATSRATGVTLNKVCGQITLFSVAGSATYQSFTVTNSTVAATDSIRVVQASGTDLYQIHVTNVAAGSFKVSFATTGGTTVEAPVFNFAVVKAVAA